MIPAVATSSNTLHLRTDDDKAAMRAYGTLLRRTGWRLRGGDDIPHYLETRDDPVFRRVLVSRPMNGWVTIIDQAFDDQRLERIDLITADMSRALRCPAVSLVVAEGEALYLFAWRRGERLDHWCSWPGWYADKPVTDAVKAHWRGHPEALLPLCRPGVSEAQLAAIVRDWSENVDSDRVVFAENILCQLQEALALEGGPRTYAMLHQKPAVLYLAVPGVRSPVALTPDRVDDDYWSAFTHLHFVNL